MSLQEKVKNLILKLNQVGVPVPLVHDPVKKQPSVSLTLVVVSALIMVVNIGLALAELAKESSMATEFFLISIGLYFGRSFTTKSGSVLPADKKE